MHDKSIAELAAGLRNGDFSSQELTRHFLSRLERFDRRLNSFITVDADGALAAAQRADALGAEDVLVGDRDAGQGAAFALAQS